MAYNAFIEEYETFWKMVYDQWHDQGIHAFQHVFHSILFPENIESAYRNFARNDTLNYDRFIHTLTEEMDGMEESDPDCLMVYNYVMDEMNGADKISYMIDLYCNWARSTGYVFQ